MSAIPHCFNKTIRIITALDFLRNISSSVILGVYCPNAKNDMLRPKKNVKKIYNYSRGEMDGVHE